MVRVQAFFKREKAVQGLNLLLTLVKLLTYRFLWVYSQTLRNVLHPNWLGWRCSGRDTSASCGVNFAYVEVSRCVTVYPQATKRGITLLPVYAFVVIHNYATIKGVEVFDVT
jgi:hypothetical protein